MNDKGQSLRFMDQEEKGPPIPHVISEKEERRLTPMKAIRRKCRDCCCDQVKEIQLCTVTNCALWPYRMGRRPRGGGACGV
jgi:copper oxidase (laccase) domain-containing protein